MGTSLRYLQSSSSTINKTLTKTIHRNPQNLVHSAPFPISTSSPGSRSHIVHLLKSCSSELHLLQLHARFTFTSLIRDPAISASFLSRAAIIHTSSPDMAYASLVFFHQITTPTTAHYNVMIRAYSRSTTSPEKAFFFYNLMRRNGVPADPISVSFAIKSCAHTASSVGGKQLHGRILQDGHQRDSLLLTSLMGLYSSCHNGLDDARKVFNEMTSPDTVAWNVLISSYSSNGRTRDALRVFDAMQLPPYSSKPDDVTCLLMLQACARLSALDFGQRVHKYIEEHGFSGALNLRNSLVAMYSKCGSVDRAFSVFCDTPNRNVVTWSAMISGLAMNGYGRDALEAFWEMQRLGVPPDDQTFTGVLSACSHAGLVDEGLEFFRSMSTEYGLSPNIHHYGCVVDLLGRAGLLDKAYGLIVNSMAVKPDSTIWRTLLGACRIHRHFDLGERIIWHLIELKGQEAGDFVLLLNIYASVQNWEKVADLRKLMKDRGIQTSPGCSTIELSGEVHEFLTDDASHPRKAEVYKMLNEIGKQLKIAGYVANMEAELHDLDLEGKGYTLSYHSEKLAIAFGILATPPGTTIRIAKNLRICVDCHTFSKVLSSVYNRVVIVRDRSHFHHFREGHCSCNDYW